MSTPRKKVTSRAEAGVVEEDFTAQPNDEVLASGELFEEPQDEIVQFAPSSVRVAGMSEEEQSMDMTPVIVGPPAYGSPVPETSAGRLLPLDEHPFNPNSLPEDHPAAIDPDYGKGYEGDIPAENIGTSYPGAPDGAEQLSLSGPEEENGGTTTDYASQTKTDLLTEAQARGLDVASDNTKAEIVSALEEDDAA